MPVWLSTPRCACSLALEYSASFVQGKKEKKPSEVGSPHTPYKSLGAKETLFEWNLTARVSSKDKLRKHKNSFRYVSFMSKNKIM